jgi:iron complex outermembrane receptor protein
MLRDEIDQDSFGITYQLSWPDRFKVGGGILYSDYSKRFTNQVGVDTSSTSAPWLYNASWALIVGKGQELYGSYSRGLEEAGIAPTTATNANAVLEAAIATQKEIGWRYATSSGVTMILAGFETRKPQVGIDVRSGAFDFLGDVRHRGIETSLSGALASSLSMVAGVAYTDAEVSGENVRLGRVGDRPVNVPQWRAIANLSYEATPRLSVDAGIDYSGACVARSSIGPDGRQLALPAATFVDLGMRYRLGSGERSLVVRAQVLNAFNRFAWRSAPGETLDYWPQRSFRLLVTAEI